jgi:hypothetical protein
MLHDELAPPQARLAEHIIQNTNRAAQLVRSLLDYAGKGQFVIRPVDISESVRLVSPLLEASLPDSITLHRHLLSGLPHIAADAENQPSHRQPRTKCRGSNSRGACGKHFGSDRRGEHCRWPTCHGRAFARADSFRHIPVPGGPRRWQRY